MCGIAGFITKDGKGPACKASQLKEMFIRAQSRGKDAAGAMWESEKEYLIHKAPNTATEMSAFLPWEKIIKGHVCLMHTRAATQGDPKENTNNHPLFSDPLVITHNGIINNWYDFVSRNLTDSYSIIEAYKQNESKDKTAYANLKKACSKLSGSATFAMWNMNEKRLFLVKHLNPLMLGFKKNTIFWASTSHIIQAVKPDIMFASPESYLYSLKGEYIKGYKIKFKKEVSIYYDDDEEGYYQHPIKWN